MKHEILFPPQPNRISITDKSNSPGRVSPITPSNHSRPRMNADRTTSRVQRARHRYVVIPKDAGCHHEQTVSSKRLQLKSWTALNKTKKTTSPRAVQRLPRSINDQKWGWISKRSNYNISSTPGLCTKTKYIQFSRSRYEGTSRNRSSSLSKEEDHELLETTNMLVICFTTLRPAKQLYMTSHWRMKTTININMLLSFHDNKDLLQPAKEQKWDIPFQWLSSAQPPWTRVRKLENHDYKHLPPPPSSFPIKSSSRAEGMRPKMFALLSYGSNTTTYLIRYYLSLTQRNQTT